MEILDWDNATTEWHTQTYDCIGDQIGNDLAYTNVVGPDVRHSGISYPLSHLKHQLNLVHLGFERKDRDELWRIRSVQSALSFQGRNHLLAFFPKIDFDVVETERIELNSCQRQDVVGYTFLHQTALIDT